MPERGHQRLEVEAVAKGFDETAKPNVTYDNRGAWQTFSDPAAQRRAMRGAGYIIERAER